MDIVAETRCVHSQPEAAWAKVPVMKSHVQVQTK